MASKKVLFTITKKYCAKYSINDAYAGKEIAIYNYSYKHIAKHKDEFYSEDSYNFAVNEIANIVSNPDFITINSGNSSMNLIKKITEDNVLVALTINYDEDDLVVKTMYPIRDFKYRVLKEKSL